MLERLLEKVKHINLDEGTLLIEKFTNYRNHFLAVNKRNEITLLIDNKNLNGLYLPSFKGKFVQIVYDTKVLINDSINCFESKFTVLSLLSTDIIKQNYFLSICNIILANLGEEPDIHNVQNELNQLIDIFSNLSKTAIKDEIGIWGELLVISIQKDKNNAVKAWHKSKSNRIDFNNGNRKIEIKSTVSNIRKHIFKLNQLNSQYNEDVLIGSIVTEEIDNGKSVTDLINEIEHGLDKNNLLNFYGKITNCLGNNFFEIEFKNFDSIFATENFLIFNAIDIPSIKPDDIQEGVTEIQFTSLLSNEKSIKTIDKFNLF